MPPRSIFVPIKPPWDRITIAQHDEYSGKSHVQLTVTNTILTYFHAIDHTGYFWKKYPIVLFFFVGLDA